MKKPVKFGIYLPEDLARELGECMKITGIRKRSKIIQEALRLFIVEHRWKTVGKASGVIGVVYNHEVRGVDEALTDIQHEYLDIIVSTVHVHLDKEKCMLAIIVRGDTGRIKELLSNIMNIKGVLITRPMLLETS
ncbi:putative transcriptional regulator, CopG family [Staphylothermus marinus F1]|uniref:Putative nickel-responsive regulator n=1 Tax=Staphylothermus marinus (strain ATCC 43588 / DSM 3639 / JCM 9404 / F1) TaxID=399550 RepID=A3DKG0_STAMF|nr:CopG family ribbon-helix-helix protein [Staphylothermus marinus]ABN69120.1 putative transcriptional regulator, CopG family [Staphylothermus marinus F1]